MISQHFIHRLNDRFSIYSKPTIEHMAQEIEHRINTVDDSVRLLSDRDFPKMKFSVNIFDTKIIVIYQVIDKLLITCMPDRKSQKKHKKRIVNKQFKCTLDQYKAAKRNICL